MEKKIVAVINRNINNFKHLPTTFSSQDTTVVVHDDPVVAYQGDKVVANFDLLITDSRSLNTSCGESWDELLEPGKLVVVDRISKPVQAMRMLAASKRLKLKDYRHIPTWFVSSSLSSERNAWHFGNGYSGICVIKHIHGARGIGQVMFDSRKIPVEVILKTLAAGTPEAITKLKEKYPDIAIPTTRQFHQTEAASLLSEDVFLQEVIHNVHSEYRVLLRPDGKHWVYSRSRKPQDGFIQACGVFDEYCQSNDYWIIDEEGSPTSKVADGVVKMFAELGLDFGSADLFIDSSGKWGIFEYCNQFGTAGYDRGAMERYHTEYVLGKLM